MPRPRQKGSRRGGGKRRGKIRLPLEVALRAYGQSAHWNERISRFVHEVVKVPAYEDRARRGERSPHRFQWRGQWYRVVDVSALWQDSRQPVPDRPEYGRAYYTVATMPPGLFQLYFERSRKEAGRWLLYRKVEFRNP
ncbi:MAG: DUF6504 family protein [bacterium]|nr:DUF6504 family protein [bacterium]